MNQRDFFDDPPEANPQAGRKLARAADPAQSHQAAAEIRPHLAELQRRLLEAVRRHPGRTSTELARLCGLGDPRVFNRRATELRRRGVLLARAVRRCTITGKQAAEWVAAEEAES